MNLQLEQLKGESGLGGQCGALGWTAIAAEGQGLRISFLPTAL